MNDLATFLAARIADDEERARFVQQQIEGPWHDPFEPWRLSWLDEYDLLCVEPSRALAECDAKRRIIELHSDDTRRDCPSCDGDAEPYERTPVWQPCPTLCALALPYAAHPEYRDEWRP